MLRDDFVQAFSEEQAAAIEAAAQMHANGINYGRIGSDPFRWAIVIVLGYECVESPNYAKSHGITVDWKTFQNWVKTNAHLENHDGDVDYVSLFAGRYNEYMPAVVPEGIPPSDSGMTVTP